MLGTRRAPRPAGSRRRAGACATHPEGKSGASCRYESYQKTRRPAASRIAEAIEQRVYSEPRRRWARRSHEGTSPRNRAQTLSLSLGGMTNSRQLSPKKRTELETLVGPSFRNRFRKTLNALTPRDTQSPQTLWQRLRAMFLGHGVALPRAPGRATCREMSSPQLRFDSTTARRLLS
jgi:hypothetical protein